MIKTQQIKFKNLIKIFEIRNLFIIGCWFLVLIPDFYLKLFFENFKKIIFLSKNLTQ